MILDRIYVIHKKQIKGEIILLNRFSKLFLALPIHN